MELIHFADVKLLLHLVFEHSAGFNLKPDDQLSTEVFDFNMYQCNVIILTFSYRPDILLNQLLQE